MLKYTCTWECAYTRMYLSINLSSSRPIWRRRVYTHTRTLFFHLYTLRGSFHSKSQEDLMPQYRQNRSLEKLQIRNIRGNGCGILFISLLILASLHPQEAASGRQTLPRGPSTANHVLLLCPQVEGAPLRAPIPHLPASPSCSTEFPLQVLEIEKENRERGRRSITSFFL